MRTILVSGASGIVGYGILKSLRRSNAALRLIGTSIYDNSIAPAFCDIFEQAPLTSDAGYKEWLLRIIKTHGVDLVIPSIEIDVYTWIEIRSEIEAAGAKAVLNDEHLVSLCNDKWIFYTSLNEGASPYLIKTSLEGDYDSIIARFGLPFLLKPRKGYASRGIVIVDSIEKFSAHKADIGNILMVQPIIGTAEKEYTTSAFCDGKGGYLAYMTLRRTLAKEGFTETAEVVEPEGISEALTSLCSQLKPLGPTNFQFRMGNDGLKLLEINPRISSSTSLRTSFGYNESAMCIDWFLDGKVPVQPQIRKGKAVRYVEDHIFYDDRNNL